MRQIKEDILMAGQGGQGIMIMGRLVAYAAMNAGYNVTWIPSYGAEVRGGTAHSIVRIDTGRLISNPLIRVPTVCIAMNRASILKFARRIVKGGLLIVDSSGAETVPETKGVRVVKAPFAGMASEIGDKRVANMLAIGALNRIKGFFPIDEIVKALPAVLRGRKDLVPLNEEALRRGYSLDLG
ncbi:MAG: 2-oxoacid:acceptor oxidoreductase family protein [Candidatus Omnitrophota bacterium]